MKGSLSSILARAERALGGNTATDAVRKVRAIIGPLALPNSEAEAQSALETLRRGEMPTSTELVALEQVVRLLRPVVPIQDGKLSDLPETANRDLRPIPIKDGWSAFRTFADEFIGSIGRIEDARGRHVGTGFVVADGVVATNRHVLGVLSAGADVMPTGAGRIVFKQEYLRANTPADIVPLRDVVRIHSCKDLVLLGASTAGRRPIALSEQLPETGTNIVTIGFPGKDEVNNPLFLGSVFDGRFGVKSAALGEVLDGTTGNDIFHDSSTTQGNSGSPVFELSTGKALGIHRSGYFMYRNEAVASAEMLSLL